MQRLMLKQRWSLLAGGALLSLAVLAAGVGLGRADDTKKEKDATKAPAKKEEPRKPEKKNDALPGFPDVDDLLKQFGGLDDDTAKILRQQLEMSRKMMEQLQKQLPGGALPQLPGGGLVPFPQLQLPIVPRINRIPGVRNGGMMMETRIGARLDRPSDTIIDQLDLPKNQGLIVQDVVPESAGAKAGLKQHDILLELDGKPVSSDVAEFQKVLKEIKPDQAVEAVVMRKTKKETIKDLKLPRETEQPAAPARGRNPFRLLNPGLGGINGLNMKITRTNDSFSATLTDNGVSYSVSGKMEDGKAKPSEITINDGKEKTYDSLDKVPEEQRDRVRALLERVEGGRRKALRL